ncbi:uncharacterized protein EKO05_0011143 [Ascochyta rabiei]|uniref:uncharacterized protein n=1 Tax=Didymella rabiei TaxID=5454 RepID=UPI0019019893|nr:uncharacterized protein EKO05_0011143 [Ascochyta rabiei]UPX20933.1 hypothetical protein EKO05_0011143 [Ascochyta rabiei]
MVTLHALSSRLASFWGKDVTATRVPPTDRLTCSRPHPAPSSLTKTRLPYKSSKHNNTTTKLPKMPSAKYTETYQKVSKMGEKLKAAGKQGPSNDEQLNLYAYAKVAEGKDFSKAEKPGMFNLAGKAKYNKWQEQVNAGLSQKDAEDKYIALGNELLKKHDN